MGIGYVIHGNRNTGMGMGYVSRKMELVNMGMEQVAWEWKLVYGHAYCSLESLGTYKL